MANEAFEIILHHKEARLNIVLERTMCLLLTLCFFQVYRESTKQKGQW